MQFTSTAFLFLFPIVAALYWTFRNLRFQNVLLLAASLVFYGWVHPWFVTLLVASTLLDYTCAIGIAERPKARNWFLGATLAGNLGLLGFYKYWGFFAENVQVVARQLGLHVSLPMLDLVLPVGISFYTFQTMSYTIDVWRGQIAARRSLLDVGLFVTFFPQLVAGPIERAGHLLTQVEQPRRFSMAQFREAWPLLLLGFWKKLVFADSIAPMVDRIFAIEDPSLPLLVTGSALFGLQIFADFSGYSDMARGLAKLLGFELMVNFDAPFLARTVPEFWRRWHISFSTWIRDYVFIPLGGSRTGGRWRQLAILVGTMGLFGLWHGAAWTYVAWGVSLGVSVWVSRQLGLDVNWRPRRAWHGAVAWVSTMATVTVCFALFRAVSLGWLGHAVAAGCTSGDAGLRAFDLHRAVDAITKAAGYGAPWAVLHLLERSGPRAQTCLGLWRWIFLGIMVGLLAQRADDGVRPFIYFQF